MPEVPPAPRDIKDVNVALVLGGGGSRGLVHVGVIEELKKNNIKIDLIVGSSIGSAVGALYADNPDVNVLKDKIKGVTREQLLDFSFLDSGKMLLDVTGPVRGTKYADFFSKNLIHQNLEDLPIPLVIVTTDIENGRDFNLSSGPIIPAVHASSAIPPFFSPVNIYGKMLVDGGILEPVPIRVAQLYCPKLIIAVDIGNRPQNGKPKNMLELTYNSIWLFYYELSRLKSKDADIIIHPPLDGFGIFEDDNKEELIEIGRKAAKGIMPLIKYKMKKLK